MRCHANSHDPALPCLSQCFWEFEVLEEEEAFRMTSADIGASNVVRA